MQSSRRQNGKVTKGQCAGAAAPGHLSPREKQTLCLLLGGLTDKEIAGRLGISRYTVNQYTKAIYVCFEVHSRGSLLAQLLRRGGQLRDVLPDAQK